MKVIVWGLGYVGTVTAACLASLGHQVVGVDVNRDKVDTLNLGRSPVKEPRLDDMVSDPVAEKKLEAAVDHEAIDHVQSADLSLICVGTPSSENGTVDLTHIKNVAESIGRGLTKKYHCVVIRSTVFPGTTRNTISKILEKNSRLEVGRDFGLVVNPEFMREGSGVEDFLNPPYTILGGFDRNSANILHQLYLGINAPVYRTTMEEAELLKLTNNAFHSLKAGFANEIGRISKHLGIDGSMVMKLVRADTKLNISPSYLKPGFAIGGSCLLKDLRSITSDPTLELPILESILQSNKIQIGSVVEEVRSKKVKRVAILGLAFKAGTDDLRESPVVELVKLLQGDGLEVTTYDPDVCSEFTLQQAISRSDFVIVTQDRDEFKHIRGSAVLNLYPR